MNSLFKWLAIILVSILTGGLALLLIIPWLLFFHRVATCPRCRETIQPKVTICKHCGEEFETPVKGHLDTVTAIIILLLGVIAIIMAASS